MQELVLEASLDGCCERGLRSCPIEELSPRWLVGNVLNGPSRPLTSQTAVIVLIMHSTCQVAVGDGFAACAMGLSDAETEGEQPLASYSQIPCLSGSCYGLG